MPRWGLTEAQRDSKPWGLPKDELRAAKTITDPIHGDIWITKLEQRFLDSSPMQRLRRIRQLGTTHLVYPGATHTRFSHSLGALRVAQDLLDVVLEHRFGPHRVPDLFGEWESLGKEEYSHRVAEATVLARLGALLHDVCHVAFGHSVEDDLQILTPHDENIKRFDTLWAQLDSETRNLVSGELYDALRYPLILSKLDDEDHPPVCFRYSFVADIVGNTICADLIDYLQRDHMFTGLPAELGHRFLDGFYVTPSTHPHSPNRMVVQIARKNRERQDVVSELFKYLRYRYEIQERVISHHAKLAADAMIGKMLQLWADYTWNRIAAREVKRVKAYERDLAQARAKIVAHAGSDAVAKKIDEEAKETIEASFLQYGDDGLIEQIHSESLAGSPTNKRLHGVAQLSEGLLNRRLYKLIGYCTDRDMAPTIHRKHGSRDGRRRLEEGVSRFAGLENRWDVVVWIPSPNMRLKVHGVLVDDGNKVSALRDRDNVGEHRGDEIYKSHEALWALSVYAHPIVRDDQELCDRILAWLAREIGSIKWKGPDRQPRIPELLTKAVAKRRQLTLDQAAELEASAESISAHNGKLDFASLAKQLENAAEELFEGSAQSDLGI